MLAREMVMQDNASINMMEVCYAGLLAGKAYGVRHLRTGLRCVEAKSRQGHSSVLRPEVSSEGGQRAALPKEEPGEDRSGVDAALCNLWDFFRDGRCPSERANLFGEMQSGSDGFSATSKAGEEYGPLRSGLRGVWGTLHSSSPCRPQTAVLLEEVSEPGNAAKTQANTGKPPALRNGEVASSSKGSTCPRQSQVSSLRRVGKAAECAPPLSSNGCGNA